LFGLKCSLNFIIVQFDSENNKKLMVKIEMEIRGKKEMETRKREKSNKNLYKININKVIIYKYTFLSI